MPSFPSSVRTAGFILLALLAYFVFRGITRAPAEDATAQTNTAAASEAAAPPQVIVRAAELLPHQVSISLKGSTEPDREVTVRSETTGTVTNAAIKEGQFVQRGTRLCGLDIESRAARIAEAEANVASARLEHDAAMQLEEKGWTTSNRAAATKAALDGAEAALQAAKIELDKVNINAPFSGVFESRNAELGDFLSIGAPCGRLVDLDPIIVAVDATEDQLGAIDPEQPVNVSFATGQSATGTVRFIARTANQQTRTFRVEIEIPNPEAKISAGLTASVELGLGEVPAVLTTPATLVLHDDGRVGVRYVDASNTVQFAEVNVIDDAADGIWISGIPNGANLLTTGQDYIKEGVEVSPITIEFSR
ncbi:MAG: efflux RND transporter periplasmic adaptor subunit [Pseudomonadota bacterium]